MVGGGGEEEEGCNHDKIMKKTEGRDWESGLEMPEMELVNSSSSSECRLIGGFHSDVFCRDGAQERSDRLAGPSDVTRRCAGKRIAYDTAVR